MKIVRTCNFGYSGERQGRDEFFELEGTVLDEKTAKIVVDAIIAQRCPDGAPHYWKVVEDEYRLSVFEP